MDFSRSMLSTRAAPTSGSIHHGVLAVNSIFIAVFLLLLIACGFIIRRTKQKVAYPVLFVSIFLQFAAFVLDVARSAIFPGHRLRNFSSAVVSLIATSEFFKFWSKAALFGSIVLFLQGRERGLVEARQASVYGSRVRTMAIAVHLLLLALIISLGTASEGLFITYDKMLREGKVDLPNAITLFKKCFSLRHAADAFVYLSAFDVAITAGVMYKYMRRMEVKDQITMYLFRVVAPLYGLLMACLLAFTVVFSRPILRKLIFSPTTGINGQLFYVLVLSNVTLTSLLLTLVIASLLWMSRKDWTITKVAEMPHDELSVMPAS